MQLHFADTVDSNYLSVGVLNNNFPVTEMWVRPVGEQEWGKLVPKYWNVFEAPGEQGAGLRVDILVDCSEAGGGKVVFENISVQAGLTVFGKANC